MADNYSQSCLRLAIAQICKSLGWDAISSSALEVLVDFTQRRMYHVGRKSKKYAEQFGRVDGTVDDVEMAFRDLGISVRDMIDYTKHVEPIKLAQPVHSYPAEAENKLIYPQLDDAVPTYPSEVEQLQNGGATAGQTENQTDTKDASGETAAPSLPANSASPSPVTPSRSRLAIGTENKPIKAIKDLKFDDEDDVEALFANAEAPNASKPPRPLNEIIVPKIKLDSVQKPKLTTGAFKPKPKSQASPVDVTPTRTPTPPPPPPPPEQPKRKTEKKKKKKPTPAAAPEGFDDIFGAPLEKPSAVPSKSSKTSNRKLSVSVQRLATPDPTSGSEIANDGDAATSSPAHEVVKSASKSQLDAVDDTIDAVLAATRENILKSEAADDAYSFDDRPVTPVELLKPSRPSQKSKQSKRSRSRSKSPIAPSSKRSNVDDTIDSVLQMGSSSKEELDVSPHSGDGDKRQKEKKEKKTKKKSRREQLLERFAAAPIESFSSQEETSAKPSSSPTTPDSKPDMQITSTLSDIEVGHKEDADNTSEAAIESPAAFPPAAGDLDDEEEIINVDEDSDVDVLGGASSPTPPPQNPYSAYQVSGQDSRPPSSGYNPSPMADQPSPVISPDPQSQIHMASFGEADEGWEMTSGAGGMEISSQTIDFSTNITTEKKEKHKKEKKEKKEKKKKKHKEKDRDREEKRSHKHQEQTESAAAEDFSIRPVDEEEPDGGLLPRLTLKLGGMSAQLPEEDTIEKVTEEPAIPKLVIKPFAGGDMNTGLDESFEGVNTPSADDSFISHDEPQQVHTLPVSGNVGLVTPGMVVTEQGMAVMAEDGKVWICPACGQPDNGSPMIGCDGECDEWFHWPCVGIVCQPPEDQQWFCPNCSKVDKKKKKKKKKDKHKN